MNSVYGFLAANMIKCKPIAASVTARGREMIENTKNYVEKNYPGSVCVYGDSVTKETPVLYRTSDGVFIDTVENLGQNWKFYRESKEQVELEGLEVWSEIGWVNAKRLIRHKTNKKIYRVITKKGIVEITEDHSLLNEKGEKLKVKDIIVNKTKLLQSRLIL